MVNRPHQPSGRPVATQRLPAALEQHGVAALEAQPADLDQRVGPRFKDHADHADGAADARKHQPVGQFGAQLLLPDGIVHRGQLFQTRADVAELVLVKLEPLERGRGQPFLFGLPHIDIVRFENLSCFRAEGGGNRQQRAVARLARRRGQRKTRLLGGVRRMAVSSARSGFSLVTCSAVGSAISLRSSPPLTAEASVTAVIAFRLVSIEPSSFVPSPSMLPRSPLFTPA